MSATHSYTAESRTALGTAAATKLRSAGKVPMTISRRGQPSRHLVLDVKQAQHLYSNVVHLCTVEIDGGKITALRGEITRNVLNDSITNIDLLEVDSSSTIKVDVAVRVDARQCAGVKAGGLVEQRVRRVKVECPANAIPDAIDISIDDVELGQTIYVDRLKAPAGMKLLTPPRLPLLSVVIPRGMRKDDAAKADEAAPAAGAPAAAAAAAAAKPGAKPDDKAKKK